MGLKGAPQSLDSGQPALFPKFALFIPMSHARHPKDKFFECAGDLHMLQILIYLTFIKLPAAFVISGIRISPVLLSGVLSIILSPLVYWMDPKYFNDSKFCLFGTTTSNSHG